MSDDWKPGDLALCVKGGPQDNLPIEPEGWPKRGHCYKVRGKCVSSYWGSLFLDLEGAPRNLDGRTIWAALRFIKITPEEADAFDHEIIDLMTSSPANPVEA